MEINTELRIFLVDDDRFSLTVYEQHLRNLGYNNVCSFENGDACLNNITQRPHVIFLDHNMEVLDGVEVLKKVKQLTPETYVVFISGREDAQTAANSLMHGAFDYIIKGDNDTSRMEQVLGKINEVRALLMKKRDKPGNRILSFI